MTNGGASPDSPLNGLDLANLPEQEKRQLAVLLLWAISRARIGHDTTTRYLAEQVHLDDYLAPFANGNAAPDSADAWSAVRASTWWASDVPPDVPLGKAEIMRSNPAGGLALSRLSLVRDDFQCGEAVRTLIELLPTGRDRDDLLYGFALDQFVLELEEEAVTRPSWPGILDAELAAGNHQLADAAAVGDWEAVLETLDSSDVRSRSLVNTWRPGGVSMVTPLHQAAINGADVEVVERLIALGAWRSLADARGWLPVDLAILHGRSELVGALTPKVNREVEVALFRVLTYRLDKLLAEITKEDAVPRFRAPQVAVIAEVGGEIEFDLTGSGHFFRIFLEEGELLVEHNSAGSADDGIVYRLDGTGVVDTWENDPLEMTQAGEQETNGDCRSAEQVDRDRVDSEEAGPVEATNPVAASTLASVPEPPDADHEEHTQSLAGVRTLWSDLGDCAVTVVPQASVRKFNRERQHASEVFVVTVSEFKKGRRWESVSVTAANEEISDQTVAGKVWTNAVIVEFGGRNAQLMQNLRLVLEREAESGLGPGSHQDLLAAMGNRSGREVSERVRILWEKVHALAIEAGVEPQRGNTIKSTGPSSGSDVADARERRGASANDDASTGGEAHFVPPIRLSLESPYFSARADWDGDTIIVKAGSAARKATLESMPAESRSIRRDLLARGIIREVAGRYVFTRDCRFRSVSSAACLVAGRTAGGRAEWKDSQGRSINDLLGGPKFRRKV
ncbi:DUF4357 domain-containing protein [Dietzia maris]